MSTCEICDITVEHRLELVEHQASLSHQIKVKGGKRVCPVCNFSCLDLPEYSKHVDSDSHISKLRALRTRRIAMVDSCFPNKNYSRLESPAYRPANVVPPPYGYPGPPPPLPVRHHPFNPFPFLRPPPHTERPPLNNEQWYGNAAPPQERWREDMHVGMPPRQQHMQQQQPQQRQQHTSPSNRGASIYTKDNRKNDLMASGSGGSPRGSPKEKKKKKKGVMSKVLSSAAIVKKLKKKEIVTTPKVSAMNNKSKRYESLALKGMGMVATNKSRTQVMMEERNIKYSLVDGQGGHIEDTRGTASSSSVTSVTAPPPAPLPRPPPSDVSFAPSTASDSTYAFCHPVHSTPHSNSNWQEFVRGMDALQEDTPSTSNIFASQQPMSGSYGELNMRRVKEEVMDEEDDIVETPVSTPIKQEPPSDNTFSMDSLNQKISAKELQLKSEYEEQQRKLSALAARREETRRRYDEEMREIDQEEKREKEKLTRLESTRASFRKDLQKVLQSHGF